MTKTEVLERFVRDLELRGRAPMTIKDYKGKILRYQDYYGKPADQLGESEIIKYLHYLATEKKVSASAVNTHNSALRFLYGVTLDVTLNYKKLPRMKQTRRLPQLFTREEVKTIIDHTQSTIKAAYRAFCASRSVCGVEFLS